jgi:hypothetical protein
MKKKTYDEGFNAGYVKAVQDMLALLKTPADLVKPPKPLIPTWTEPPLPWGEPYSLMWRGVEDPKIDPHDFICQCGCGKPRCEER